MATPLKTRAESRQNAADVAREKLTRHEILAVAVVGPPGAGKTALIEAVARQLRGQARVGVLILHPSAERDRERVSRYCAQVVSVEVAAPTAESVAAGIDKFDMDRLDIVLIESVGGIAGPLLLGQHATVSVLSVTGGDDKIGEYEKLITSSQLLILTMAELQRHVAFDRGVFRRDLHRVNPSIALIEVSAFENTGIARWTQWLEELRALIFSRDADRQNADDRAPAIFFG